VTAPASPYQILDFVSNGCCILGEDGQIVFWNRTLELWTRLTIQDLAGLNLFEAFPSLAQPRFKDRILGVLQTGAPTFFSSTLNPEFFPCKRANGRPRIQQTALNRLVSAEGKHQVLITISDVTDQHERGEKYRSARAEAMEEARIRGESEALYRLVVGLSTAAILICDAQGHILDGNPTASQIFQASQVELTTLQLADLLASAHGEVIRELFSTSGAPDLSNLEFMGLRRNGSSFPLDLTIKTFPSGEQQRFVAYIHDITERKRAEEALRYAQKQESLGALAGGIAHDFNNLFGGILGNLDLCEKHVDLDLGARLHMDRIRNGVLRAAELSQKMLAFSGTGRFSLTSLDLNHLLEEFAPELTPDLSKNALLRCRFAGNLPPIEADPSQIRLLVQYLVTNSAEALGSEEGTIDLLTGHQDLDVETLRLACPGQSLSPGRYVTLEVADTGCGISTENLPRIFDPFFSTKFAGRGLSLPVALGILRGHKAGFAISSAVGVGTRFKLFFPALPAGPERKNHRKSTVQPVSGKILVVDDEPILRDTIQDQLEAMGYEVSTAVDGLDAVEHFRKNRDEIALVLMDLTMPRMDGHEAFRRIREIDPGARVILSSGFSEQEAVYRFQDEDISAFLAKPYRFSQLQAAVGAFVKPRNR
jgi:two-component system cell cycle sensor histidine kinase/response regulator CckA